VCFFKAYTFDRVKVITPTNYAASEKHIISEVLEIELLDILKPLKVDLCAVSQLVHFEQDSLYSKDKQIRVLCNYSSHTLCKIQVGKLGIGLIGCNVILYSLRLKKLNEFISHLRSDIDRLCKLPLCHHAVPLSKEFFSFLSSFFSVFPPLSFCVAFHLKPAAVKDDDWLYACAKQELKF
jgi:hypothetical protein